MNYLSGGTKIVIKKENKMNDINWDNKEEVINAIKENVFFVIKNKSKINKNLLNDYEVGMEFIMGYTYSLELLSDELRNNYDIVMTAVTNSGLSLEYASEELQNNFDIVKTAVANDNMALKYASEELKNNYDIIMMAVTKYGEAFRYASKEMHNNLSILTIAVKKNKNLIKYAGDKILNNKEEVIWIYNNLNKEILKFANEEMQRQIIMQFIRNDDEILRYVSNKILEDKEFMIECIKINFDAMNPISNYYCGCNCDNCDYHRHY